MRRSVLLAAFGALIAVASTVPLGAEESTIAPASSKERKIRELLESTGSGQLGVQVVNQMLPAFKKMVPQAPESFWQDFMKEVKPETLVELVVPIYDKYFEEAELDAIIAFYASPAGKKTVQVLPAIMAESMQVGQKWGEELAKKVIDRARKEGLKVNT
jgi:hypothetical protein